jgi:predicted membrane-bound spermidine synthase
MIRLIFPLVILLIIILLFSKNKLSSDLSGLFIVILAIFLVISNHVPFLYFLAGILSVNYVPLAILAVAIGLLFGLCICLAVMIHDTRQRQVKLLAKLALLEIKQKTNH